MGITVIPPSTPTPPTAPATPNTVSTQLFTATGATGAGSPAQYAVGDMLERTVVYSGTTVISTTWSNATKGTTLTVTPPGVDLAATTSSPLTNDELRAATVHVTVDNFPAPVAPIPSPTVTQFFSDTFIATATDTSAPLEYVKGDYLAREIVYNTSTSTVVSTTWKNLSTGVTMTQAPAGADLAATSASGLTDDELRAAPVEVFVVNQNAPVAAATAFQLFSDNFIATANDATAPLEFSKGDYLVREVTYNTATAAVVSTVWKNLSTGITMTQAPAGTAIAQTPGNGLTDAELRASAVHVIVDNQVTLPASAAVTTKQTIVESYTVLANDAVNGEYVIGDVIDRTLVVDNATTPVTIISDVWYNRSQGFQLTSVPSGAALAQNSTSALTNSELRASPVAVTMVKDSNSGIQPATTLDVDNDIYQAFRNDAINVTPQYAAGDFLRRETVYDASTNPVTIVQTKWFNDVYQVEIDPPPSTDITRSVETPLTNAELRAQEVLMAPYWENYGVVTDSSGNMVREYEQNYNYTIQIYRDWTTTVNPDGSISQIAGIWKTVVGDIPF